MLSNEHRKAIIIDAGMYEENEQKRFAEYISKQHLEPIALLITHAHPDHICGIEYLQHQYGLQAIIQPAEGQLNIAGLDTPINVISTPGHKEDAVCYYLPQEKLLFLRAARTSLPLEGGGFVRSLRPNEARGSSL